MSRIFHLIKSLGRGGAEVLLAEGLRYSDRGLFELGYGYFISNKTAMVPDLEEMGATVVCFSAENNLSIIMAARRVSRFLSQWQADLIHCHLPIAGVVGRLAARMSGIPLIYTEHNRMERYHPITRRMNLTTWRWQDRVIAVSEEVAASIRTHVGDFRPIHVVLNGVDIRHFGGESIDEIQARHRLGIPAEAPIVGTVAVFRAQKALGDWLHAAQAIHALLPSVHFVLVGDGPLRAELMGLARSLDLGDVVHFPGLQRDVRPYLAAMDVFMSSSLFEGLPVALLEAMAMRRPAVATAVGGVPEVVVHGENGYLVEPRRPEALAEAVLQLIASRDKLLRFGERARQTVENGFSLIRMTREIESIYLEVLESCRNGT